MPPRSSLSQDRDTLPSFYGGERWSVGESTPSEGSPRSGGTCPGRRSLSRRRVERRSDRAGHRRPAVGAGVVAGRDRLALRVEADLVGQNQRLNPAARGIAEVL